MLALLSMCPNLQTKVHAVVPHKLYRSSQMCRKKLTRAIKRYKIKTIINLRGPNPDKEWYLAEHAVAQELDVTVHDIALSARKLPNATQVKMLTAIFNSSNDPILIHCNRGCDRTSSACALYRFEYALRNKLPMRTAQKLAKRQLSSLRFGHWRILFPAVDRFVHIWIKLREKHGDLICALNHYNPHNEPYYEVS